MPSSSTRSKPFCPTMREIDPNQRLRERRAIGRQPVPCQHGHLRGVLALEVPGGESRGEVRITQRIPLLDVYPVQDARQVLLPLAENAVETETAGRLLNLLRVRRTHGGE